jgi:site-specific DNA recombinase
MTKLVALYARVSSERQVQQATIDSQLAALRARATHDGCAVLPSDEYVDNGHSGTTLRRPALERLRDRVAQGAVDTIYVHSPDRLARRHAHQVLLLEEFASRGVRVTMIEGRSGDSAEDQLLIQVQGVIAEYERAKIMERSRRGKLHKARAGSVNVLSSAPYGYHYVKKIDSAPAHYQVVLHEARVVRKIFEAVVREHKSLRAVARMLNEEGIAPGESKRRQAARWQSSAIARALRNPSYMGLAAFGKTECVEPPVSLRPVMGRAAVPKKAKSGVRKRPANEWIHIPVPAIVSEDLFIAAQAQLERNRAFAQRNRGKGRYLLSGLTVCARCGYGYYGRTLFDGSRRTRHAYYYCGATGRSAKSALVAVPGCRNRGVRVEPLEAHVWQTVCSLLEDPARMMREWTRRADTHRARNEHEAQRADALRVIRSHEHALKRLVDAYEAGAIDLAELTTRTTHVRARLGRARDDLAALEKVFAEKHAMQLVVASIAEFGQRLRKGLDKLSWEERRRIVRTVVARIEIDSDDVTVVFRVPAAGTTTAPAPRGSATGDFVGCAAGVNTPP